MRGTNISDISGACIYCKEIKETNTTRPHSDKSCLCISSFTTSQPAHQPYHPHRYPVTSLIGRSLHMATSKRSGRLASKPEPFRIFMTSAEWDGMGPQLMAKWWEESGKMMRNPWDVSVPGDWPNGLRLALLFPRNRWYFATKIHPKWPFSLRKSLGINGPVWPSGFLGLQKLVGLVRGVDLGKDFWGTTHLRGSWTTHAELMVQCACHHVTDDCYHWLM